MHAFDFTVAPPWLLRISVTTVLKTSLLSTLLRSSSSTAMAFPAPFCSTQAGRVAGLGVGSGRKGEEGGVCQSYLLQRPKELDLLGARNEDELAGCQHHQRLGDLVAHKPCLRAEGAVHPQQDAEERRRIGQPANSAREVGDAVPPSAGRGPTRRPTTRPGLLFAGAGRRGSGLARHRPGAVPLAGGRDRWARRPVHAAGKLAPKWPDSCQPLAGAQRGAVRGQLRLGRAICAQERSMAAL